MLGWVCLWCMLIVFGHDGLLVVHLFCVFGCFGVSGLLSMWGGVVDIGLFVVCLLCGDLAVALYTVCVLWFCCLIVALLCVDVVFDLVGSWLLINSVVYFDRLVC